LNFFEGIGTGIARNPKTILSSMEPSLDSWTIIFLFAAVQGVFLSVVIFTYKGRDRRATGLLGAIVGLFTLTLFYYVAFWTGYEVYLPGIASVVLIFPFLFGPLMLLYFKSLKGFKAKASYWWHFVPFAFFFVHSLPIYLGLEVSSIPGFLRQLYNYNLMIASTIILNLHLSVYSIVMIIIERNGRNKSAKVMEEWLRTFTWLFAGFTLSFISYYIMSATNTLKLEYDYMISFTMSIIIYYIGYNGYKNPALFRGFKMVESQGKYQRSTLTEMAAASLESTLKDHMVNFKPYLNNDLKMQNLANNLGLSVHYLSEVINRRLKQNFSDFINSYRIREAIKMLKDPDCENEKIINIAYDSGFNNKVSFNNAFKKHTGMTPGEYKAKNRKKVRLISIV